MEFFVERKWPLDWPTLPDFPPNMSQPPIWMARNHPVRLFIILAQYSNELGWRYSQKCWSFPEGGRVFGLKFNWLRRNLWNVQTSKKPSSNRMTTTPKKSPSCSPSFCPHLNNRIFKGKRYLVISTDFCGNWGRHTAAAVAALSLELAACCSSSSSLYLPAHQVF